MRGTSPDPRWTACTPWSGRGRGTPDKFPDRMGRLSATTPPRSCATYSCGIDNVIATHCFQ